MAIVLLLAGCGINRTTTVAESREARTETSRDVVRTVDSVCVVDSVYVYVTSEEVYHTHWRTVYRDRIVHDTVREYTIDTVFRSVGVEKEKAMTSVSPSRQRRNIPAWAWLSALVLAGLVITHIMRVKQRLNNR